MTNNSGDMTNNISDERLKKLIKTNDKESRFGRNGYYADIGNALAELLSARETIRRLVEDGKWLHQSLCAYLDYADDLLRGKCYDPLGAIEAHTALLAELEGKGFDATMKRVVDENKGAWKALADGEEGKG